MSKSNNNDYLNIEDLVKSKNEIIKLKEEIKKLASKKAMKENEITGIRQRCNDSILVKISTNGVDNNDNYEYYCLFCEKKIDNFVNDGKQAVIDFSGFLYDDGNLTVLDKLDISFELYHESKKSYPLVSDEAIVSTINFSIRELDEVVKEKVMRKLFESLGVFSKRRRILLKTK